MKPLLLPLLLLPGALLGQPDSLRIHRGFHASVSIGPAFGAIDDRARNLKNPDDPRNIHLKYDGGSGLALELRLGYALNPRMAITGDVISRVISGPRISGGLNVDAPENVSVGDVTYGAGFTYFFMPRNFFIGATAGVGVFVVQDSETNTTVRSNGGWSGQLRAGKAWWLGKKLQAGVSASGSYTQARTVKEGITEDLTGQWGMISAMLLFQ